MPMNAIQHQNHESKTKIQNPTINTFCSVRLNELIAVKDRYRIS